MTAPAEPTAASPSGADRLSSLLDGGPQLFAATVERLQNLDVVQWMMVVLGLSALIVTFGEGMVLSRLQRARRATGGAPYDWRAFWATVRINLWRTLVEAIPMGAVLGASLPLGAWAYEHRLWTVPTNTWWGIGLLFLCTEFFYYWMHRAGHRIRWYWASHQVHHSGNQFNLAAAFRQSLTGKVTGGFVFFFPQCFLGFTPEAVLLSYGVNLVYQFWIHAEWIPRLGWMEGIFNTPSAHRVHHGTNPEYLDANYGGVLLVFDRLFGTYAPEREDIAIRYGLVKPLTTHNALWICLHEWIAIGRDLLRRPLWQAPGILFGPPGWAPGDQGSTTEDMRRRAGLPAHRPRGGDAPAAAARAPAAGGAGQAASVGEAVAPSAAG
jgi:sterol desaturase/sphingolipid hydroxylase (fatty acid hydroxylase superfamily)